MNIKVYWNYKRLLSIALSVLLAASTLASVGCQSEPAETGKAPSESSAPDRPGATSSEGAAVSEDPENPRVTLDPKEWESGGQCYSSHDRLYFPAEVREPVEAETLTDAQYAEGYRLDLDLGISYYEPTIWRELQGVLSRDLVGNPQFADMPIANGRYFYYAPPSVAVALEDLSSIDLPEEEKAKQREELMAQRVPLFGLLLFRNEKLPEDLQELDAPRGFNERKILHQDDQYTLVLAVAPYQEGVVGEAFANDYKMIYEGRETIVNSLHFFKPESAEEQLRKRGWVDFELMDLNGKAAGKGALYPEKRNFLLIWNDQISSQREYYQRLAHLAASEKLPIQALWAGTQNEHEAAKMRLLGYMAGIEQPLPNYVAGEEGNSALFQYLKFTPALVEIDGSGQIVQVIYGVKPIDEIRDLMLK